MNEVERVMGLVGKAIAEQGNYSVDVYVSRTTNAPYYLNPSAKKVVAATNAVEAAIRGLVEERDRLRDALERLIGVKDGDMDYHGALDQAEEALKGSA